MPGPTCSVLLREALSPEREDRLRVLIRGLAGQVHGDDFWIEQRPFFVSTEEDYPGELADLVEEGVADLIGWSPEATIGLAAMCNDGIDHRLLGEVCLRVAREFGGVIAFGGAISAGPLLDGSGPSALVLDDPGGLRGRVFAISYTAHGGRYCTSHYGDATLLESWLKDPRFRMVK